MSTNGRRRQLGKRSRRATIERFRPSKIAGYLNTRERAKLPCGCCIYVGISSETRATATAAQPCSEKHAMLTELANTLLAKRLESPERRRLMVELCVEVLSEAAATV